VYGQFLGRDFNPLAKLLLLRTPGPLFVSPCLLVSDQKWIISGSSSESWQSSVYFNCSDDFFLALLHQKKMLLFMLFTIGFALFEDQDCPIISALLRKNLVKYFFYAE
jgi:hypothetical protein